MSMRILLFSSWLFFASFLQAQSWQKISTQGDVPAVQHASAVLDTRTGNILLFGGITDKGNSNELWHFNMQTLTWSLFPVNGNAVPKGRFTHVCMFDSLTHRLILFSGQGDELYNDVWAFHLDDSTWHELFKDGNVPDAPLKRYGTATGFDPKTRQVVNFAGFTTSGRFDDTWAFDLNGQTWQNKTSSFFPLKRCLTSQAMIPSKRQMVVYAGQSNGDLDDLWSLNLDSYQWENLSPTTRPVARHFPSIEYIGRDQLLLFGGHGGRPLGDTWLFDLTARQWSKLDITDPPEPRYGHVMVYLPQLHALWLFGGSNTTKKLNDMWLYRELPTSIPPSTYLESKISIAPNPVHDHIYFPGLESAVYRISIIDTWGREVLTTFLQGNEVDLPLEIKPDAYLIRLQRENRTFWGKMVKE
jgi:hypothetical protein